MSWNKMSKGSMKAAYVLRRYQIRRSAINRAYYAAFSAVTAALRKRTIDFPSGYEHPPHYQIGRFVKRHMTQMTKADRNELRDAIGRLCEARIEADYRRDSDPADDDISKAFADAEYVITTLSRL